MTARAVIIQQSISEILRRWDSIDRERCYTIDGWGRPDYTGPARSQRFWKEIALQKKSDYWFPDVLQSLKEHGFVRPCTAIYEPDFDTYIFGDGHHRLFAAQQLKMKTVPVRLLPYRSAYLISGDTAEWRLGDRIPRGKTAA
jgi:hypothetical protein